MYLPITSLNLHNLLCQKRSDFRMLPNRHHTSANASAMLGQHCNAVDSMYSVILPLKQEAVAADLKTVKKISCYWAVSCLPWWLIRSGCGFESSWPVGCLSSRLCIYCAPNCSGVCSAAYGTVYYKEPLHHSIRVGHSPDFRILSVAILPLLCRKRLKAIFTHSTH